MDSRLLTALGSAAEAIHASARSHKRAEAAHRRQARDLMKAFELLRRECERHGVQLEITQTPRRESQ